jgi:hypothetical protein
MANLIVPFRPLALVVTTDWVSYDLKEYAALARLIGGKYQVAGTG